MGPAGFVLVAVRVKKKQTCNQLLSVCRETETDFCPLRGLPYHFGLRIRQFQIVSVTVDGAWSAWSFWSPCDKLCGGGVRERTRSCTNPPSLSGGKGCGSHYHESKECAVNKCPPFICLSISPSVQLCFSLSVRSSVRVSIRVPVRPFFSLSL